MAFSARQWPVNVDGGDIVLRPIRRGDKHEWMHLRRVNASWLAPWEPSQPVPDGTAPTYGEMVSGLNRQARSGHCLPWLITRRDPLLSRVPIVGQLTVSGISYGAARSASLGYWVDSSCAGHGIVPTAVALATDHCFGTLGLHRMEINIRPENAASLRVVQKLGFRDEGLRERYLHINGAWADHRTFALTSEEVPEGLLARWRGGSGGR
ncbi:GNAT family N-acetyltransferase [Paeniglutamicibacter cryotolerans]|uniref:Ribosomal-protein-alanine N-acetyltransferase n=1 Tax=Paeniglutamicibacter cryotolerans TaxID=670079 RepID=A0A839QH96_9MICC|nr:GNAT family protein [Paeniglutamicibacter cryotolerans]MBB2993845.1 ribosomal-protein-alanine N-acetyltransferase [Paeniglutamicibacter cryotolerans]